MPVVIAARPIGGDIISGSDQVDPDLLPLLRQFPAIELTVPGLPAARAVMQSMLARNDTALPAGVAVREVLIERERDGALRALVFEPDGRGAALPGLLHIHGGGFVLGAPEVDRAQNAALAVELNAVIVSVDYRLAPEAPHPAGLEDCFAALCWLHGSALALGVDPCRVGVMGESAGGGLAAALCLLARDRGVAIATQTLLYPMLDDRTGPERATDAIGAFVWTPALNAFGWRCLLGDADGAGRPVAAAARAEDLAGLPPTFIAVGALDLFLQESLDFASRLSAAGVPIELHVYPGAVHGFDRATQARVTHQFKQDRLRALKRGLG